MQKATITVLAVGLSLLATVALAGTIAPALQEQLANSAADQPVSVIVFGSFARGEADEHSDLDAVVVRPDDVDEDDDAWATATEQWRSDAQAITMVPDEVISTPVLMVARGTFK